MENRSICVYPEFLFPFVFYRYKVLIFSEPAPSQSGYVRPAVF